MIAEFKEKYPGFVLDFWAESKESDPIVDLLKFREAMINFGHKSRKMFFISNENFRLLYGDFFLGWSQPTDWDLYLLANENLRQWRKRLAKKMQRKINQLNQKKQQKQQWRADERRRSRRKMPGR